MFFVWWLLLGRDGCKRNAFCISLCLSGLAAKVVDVVEDLTFLVSGGARCGSNGSKNQTWFLYGGTRCESNGLKNQTCFCLVALAAEEMV